MPSKLIDYKHIGISVFPIRLSQNNYWQWLILVVSLVDRSSIYAHGTRTQVSAFQKLVYRVPIPWES